MSTLILWNLYTENVEVLSTLKGINSVFDTKYLLYIWFYNISGVLDSKTFISTEADVSLT